MEINYNKIKKIILEQCEKELKEGKSNREVGLSIPVKAYKQINKDLLSEGEKEEFEEFINDLMEEFQDNHPY